MNLRFDKVIRSAGFGFRKVYSLVLDEEGLYLIRTGRAGTLKHFRLDPASHQAVTDHTADRGVKELQANEARIDTTPLDELLNADRDSYWVRLEAIEDVEVRAARQPAMALKLSGSDHYLSFPFATLEEVQALQRALNKWSSAR
jgi:hypothetical protein